MLPFFTTNPATVLTPSGKTHYPKIEDNKDGTVTIRYQPTESGLHELDVRYNKEPIQGTMDDLRNFNYAKSKKQNQMLSDVWVFQLLKVDAHCLKKLRLWYFTFERHYIWVSIHE